MMVRHTRLHRRDVARQVDRAQRLLVDPCIALIQVDAPAVPVPNVVPPSPTKCLAQASTASGLVRSAALETANRRLAELLHHFGVPE